jgi:tRNA1Val (adenine37-N6)-methyltransferase
VANSYFQFKQFILHQDRCAMKVTTDACLFGAWAAEKVGSSESGVREVLDIGTGTGLLSLMLAQKINASMDAIEIDEDAFEQAKENVTSSAFADRINVVHADANTFSFQKKYDLIISNPPFYEKELTSVSNKKNIAHHREGLLLGSLLEIIQQQLSPKGLFFLLLPFKRNKEIKQLLIQKKLAVSKMVFVRQSTSHDYFRIMITGNLYSDNEAETIMDEISIWNDKQQYTEDFIELLKDYYLYL